MLALPAGIAALVVVWVAAAIVEHVGQWHFSLDPSAIGGLAGLLVMLAAARSGQKQRPPGTNQ
jgi:hypothetical protein